jgi:diguanylate cyclase (GGDEF)-like protein
MDVALSGSGCRIDDHVMHARPIRSSSVVPSADPGGSLAPWQEEGDPPGRDDGRPALSLVDDLTGLPDGRFFALSLEIELARCRRLGLPLAMAIVGLGADDLVRDAARVLLARTRRMAVICRHDERAFAVLLPETTAAGARLFAEGIVGALLGGGRPVAASVGVSSFPDGATTSDALVRGAEDALHAARQAGSNRVAVWAGPGIGRCGPSRVPAP